MVLGNFSIHTGGSWVKIYSFVFVVCCCGVLSWAGTADAVYHGTEIANNSIQKQKINGHEDTQSRNREALPSQESVDQKGKSEEENSMTPYAAWRDKISLGGLVEVEGKYTRLKDLSMDKSSDLTLANAQLEVGVDAAPGVSGRVALLYQENDQESVTVDEAVISLVGSDPYQFYLNVGKMYLPFGAFESHFISDPATLVLGETRETAIQIGFTDKVFDISVSAFNGDISINGKGDHIDGFVVNSTLSLPENVLDDLGISFGASYSSHIADSQTLQDTASNEGLSTGSIADSVSGFSTYLSVVIFDRLFIDGEYVGAMKSFQNGELAFDGGNSIKPRTWNSELALAVTPDIEAAVKYEGSKEFGDVVPESQIGGALLFRLQKHLSLGLEYLYGEFESGAERNQLTFRLSLEI